MKTRHRVLKRFLLSGASMWQNCHSKPSRITLEFMLPPLGQSCKVRSNPQITSKYFTQSSCTLVIVLCVLKNPQRQWCFKNRFVCETEHVNLKGVLHLFGVGLALRSVCHRFLRLESMVPCKLCVCNCLIACEILTHFAKISYKLQV